LEKSVQQLNFCLASKLRNFYALFDILERSCEWENKEKFAIQNKVEEKIVGTYYEQLEGKMMGGGNGKKTLKMLNR
jgi:hypothetical protein